MVLYCIPQIVVDFVCLFPFQYHMNKHSKLPIKKYLYVKKATDTVLCYNYPVLNNWNQFWWELNMVEPY